MRQCYLSVYVGYSLRDCATQILAFALPLNYNSRTILQFTNADFAVALNC